MPRLLPLLHPVGLPIGIKTLVRVTHEGVQRPFVYNHIKFACPSKRQEERGGITWRQPYVPRDPDRRTWQALDSIVWNRCKGSLEGVEEERGKGGVGVRAPQCEDGR